MGWYSKREPGGQFKRQEAKRDKRRSRSNQSKGRNGALGKPALCRKSCSTVTASLPLLANSGTMSAAFSSTRKSPDSISSHAAALVSALVEENTQ